MSEKLSVWSLSNQTSFSSLSNQTSFSSFSGPWRVWLNTNSNGLNPNEISVASLNVNNRRGIPSSQSFFSWKQYNQIIEWSVVYQVVIPSMYHKTMLSLAHDTLLVGHLGVKKIFGCLLNHFYWPGVCKDVKHFCRSWHTYQVMGKPNQKIKAVPLRPILVAKEPFPMSLLTVWAPYLRP